MAFFCIQTRQKIVKIRGRAYCSGEMWNFGGPETPPEKGSFLAILDPFFGPPLEGVLRTPKMGLFGSPGDGGCGDPIARSWKTGYFQGPPIRSRRRGSGRSRVSGCRQETPHTIGGCGDGPESESGIHPRNCHPESVFGKVPSLQSS